MQMLSFLSAAPWFLPFILSMALVDSFLLLTVPKVMAERCVSISSQSSLSESASLLHVPRALEVDATTEVVGASGRIGSLFLREKGAMAVPRGVVPGCLSSGHIVVATPSKEWTSIYQLTEPDRRDDLVWVGNGLLSDFQENATVILPHFGVLQPNANAVTSHDSPPTYVYGKHANIMADVLARQGIPVIQQIHSWTTICQLAARKLAWASCLWLLCHDPSPSRDSPLTVSQVHAQKSHELEQLVRELLPVLEELTGSKAETVEDIMSYMYSYSMSMPNAVPSKQLALDELIHRNGVFFRETSQPLHSQLLHRVAGINFLPQIFKTNPDSDPLNNTKKVHLPEAKLICFGRVDAPQHQRQDEVTTVNHEDNKNNTNSRSCLKIVIVGGGIIGSSIARSFLRRGFTNVTVYDPTPTGRTSPASWAWLNANQKSPPHYKWLNQLGMRAWRVDPLLKDLPTWNGSLVCFPELQNNDNMGGYSVEGPLDETRIKEIEPNADFPQGHVYSFPDEGCVDPCQAVLTLRGDDMTIISNEIVVGLVRDTTTGRVVGIQTTRTLDANAAVENIITTFADIVIVAAGTGSANKAFGGGLALISSPGRISFARPAAAVGGTQRKLDTLLVDMIRESHVLQRKDGTLVAGGGVLEIGGSSSTADQLGTKRTATPSAKMEGEILMRRAELLAPAALEGSVYTHCEEAVRPMPQDGLPIVGWVEEGLYTVVTHSGVTLSPILGQLVAAEVCEQVSLEVLRDYRPSRFTMVQTSER
ncbi:FAD dependent oxidoreductase [Fragilaria crotonensis]|nr:FAD dependent oxidoreductase [Fragilaria crotonensis]